MSTSQVLFYAKRLRTLYTYLGIFCVVSYYFCTELYDFKDSYRMQIICKQIYLSNEALKGNTTSCQSGTGSYGNEMLLASLQNYSPTETVYDHIQDISFFLVEGIIWENSKLCQLGERKRND